MTSPLSRHLRMIADGLSDKHEKDSVISAADLLEAKPGASCSAGSEGPYAWRCCDRHYPHIYGIVTDRQVTVDAWREGGIEFQALYPVGAQQPSNRPHEAPEWLWYGEVDGKPVVTFGRWPKHGAQWRYKWAEIQPTEHDHPMTRDGETKTVETQTVAGRHLAALILEYARDLRRNSSGGDDYPWEYAKVTADYLEELVRRSGVEINMSHAILSENAGQVFPDLGPNWCPDNPHIAAMFSKAAQPPAAPVETDCDTVKHMWDQVEKARTEGTFSSPHQSCSAGNDAEIEALERTVEAMHSTIEQLHAENVVLRNALSQQPAPAPLMDAGSIFTFLRERMEDETSASLAVACRALADHLRVLRAVPQTVSPQATTIARPDDKVWPDGCQDANSCASHMACMYKNCWHEWRDISSEVRSALSRPERA